MDEGWDPRRAAVFGPFGTPDGARADLSPVNYVSLSDLGIARPGDYDRIRVVAGKQGAGKTLYLRHVANEIAGRAELYASGPPDYDAPSTRSVIRFSSLFRPSVRTEMWQLAWDRAILRAVASHASSVRYPHTTGTDSFLAHLDVYGLRDLVPSRPSTPYRELKVLASDFDLGTRAVRRLEDPRWEHLRDELRHWMTRQPPLYFFVDAIDEEFQMAPPYWLACQKGLFLAVMRLLRDHSLGSRLHVVISVRDLVLSAIALSEHGPRMLTEPRILVLDWDANALELLCQHKLVQLLGDAHAPRSDINGLLKEWLGIESVTNTLGLKERVWDYLIRHTRCVPRDLVSLLNALHRRRLAAVLLEQDVVEEVRHSSRLFGFAQLALVRNDLLSSAAGEADSVHNQIDDLRFDLRESYAPKQEYVDTYTSILTNLLKASVDPKMKHGKLDTLRERSVKAFGTDVVNVLWRHGLLGLLEFEDRKTGMAAAHFHRVSRWDTMDLPVSHSGLYVLHPCLLEALNCQIGEDEIVPVYGGS